MLYQVSYEHHIEEHLDILQYCYHHCAFFIYQFAIFDNGMMFPENREASDASFKSGDRVQISLETDVFQMMQEGHGGWNPVMAAVRHMNECRMNLF